MRWLGVYVVGLGAGCSQDLPDLKDFNAPPQVSVLEPEEDTTAQEGASLTFLALANDNQLAELSVQWSSDRDGPLLEDGQVDADGHTQFTTAALTPGFHAISVNVTDLEGSSAQDSVNVRILEVADAPDLIIEHPAGGETGTEEIPFAFVVTANDLQDAPSDLLVQLESSEDGYICHLPVDSTGEGRCMEILSVGTHLLTFSAIDTDGFITERTAFFDVLQNLDVDDDNDGWTLAEGDCDDVDADSWPGALERLDDGRDQDCDGTPDASAFGFSDFTWTAPTNPEVGRVDDAFLLLIGAASADLLVAHAEEGVGIPFALAEARGGRTEIYTSFPTWKGNPNTLLQGVIDAAPDPMPEDIDFDGIPDPTLYVTTTYTNDFQTWTFLSGIRYRSDNGALLSPPQTFHNLSPTYDALDVDLAFDGDGEPFTLACAPTRMHAIHTVQSPAHTTNSLLGADVCYFSSAPVMAGTAWEAPLHRCDAGACEDWTLTDNPTLVQGAVNGGDWIFGDYEMGWLVRIDAAGTGWLTDTTGAVGDVEVLSGETLLHLDVSEHQGTLYLAAIVAGAAGPEVWLQHGAADALVRQQLAFDNPVFPDALPSSVAIHADADRVFVAVTALDPLARPGFDSVGWLFLGP